MSVSALLLALAARPAAGQTVQGVVADGQTQAALANAIVHLVDDDGERRVATATDATGRYSIQIPAPGRYRVRAELLGYEARESDSFETAEGSSTIVRDLRMNALPIPIQGVEVTTDQATRRLRQFLGISPGQLRIRPVRTQTIEEHARRGDDLVDLMAMRNIPNLQVVRSRTGPCFQFRGRDCLPLYLDGARLDRSSTRELPLEMLNTIVILLPSETVAYPGGAVLLFTIGFMR